MSGEKPSRADMLRAAVDAYFAAIAARDPQRIAMACGEECEIEDPVGSPIRCGRDAVAALFASGVAALATHVEIHVLAALPSGDSIAAHWTMTARGKQGREVEAEGIDVLQVDAGGLIVRAEGYWKAAAFRQALATNTDTRVKIKSVSKHDDFTEMPESKFLELCRVAKIVTTSMYNKLKGRLDDRNGAAHPSGVTTTPKFAEAYVEDMVENVIRKFPV